MVAGPSVILAAQPAIRRIAPVTAVRRRFDIADRSPVVRPESNRFRTAGATEFPSAFRISVRDFSFLPAFSEIVSLHSNFTRRREIRRSALQTEAQMTVTYATKTVGDVEVFY